MSAKYCDEYVRLCCVSVCLSVCTHIPETETTRPNFTSFFVHVAHGCGSVVLWRRYDMLCILLILWFCG